jgi:hypothetical protein
MMSFKDGVGQVIKLTGTRLAGIPLAIGLMGMLPAFHDLGTVASRAANTCGPTQLPDHFIALGIIDQGLYVNDHANHQFWPSP